MASTLAVQTNYSYKTNTRSGSKFFGGPTSDLKFVIPVKAGGTFTVDPYNTNNVYELNGDATADFSSWSNVVNTKCHIVAKVACVLTYQNLTVNQSAIVVRLDDTVLTQTNSTINQLQLQAGCVVTAVHSPQICSLTANAQGQTAPLLLTQNTISLGTIQTNGSNKLSLCKLSNSSDVLIDLSTGGNSYSCVQTYTVLIENTSSGQSNNIRVKSPGTVIVRVLTADGSNLTASSSTLTAPSASTTTNMVASGKTFVTISQLASSSPTFIVTVA
jgi:hypothetical protein